MNARESTSYTATFVDAVGRTMTFNGLHIWHCFDRNTQCMLLCCEVNDAPKSDGTSVTLTRSSRTGLGFEPRNHLSATNDTDNLAVLDDWHAFDPMPLEQRSDVGNRGIGDADLALTHYRQFAAAAPNEKIAECRLGVRRDVGHERG